ncbi:unnamed protein product, partial [Medioppia subpectinata]
PLEVVGDLTKTSDLNNLIDSTVKTFGKIDVLVNNAGILINTNITSPDLLSVWDQIFAIDLRAIVEITHRSVPHLEKTNGTIIDISSILSMAPYKNALAFSSAKAGLDMLTKILALELGPKGIRVNTITPGAIQNRDTLTPIEKLAAKYTPLGRVGQPLDIARAVAFLASTDAHFITGANIVVDGGVSKPHLIQTAGVRAPVGARHRVFVVTVSGHTVESPTGVLSQDIHHLTTQYQSQNLVSDGRGGVSYCHACTLMFGLVCIVSADYPIEDYKAVAKSRNFTGSVVVVTGSSSGIGEGIVKLFSILGANVVVTGRTAQDVQRVAKEVQELSPLKLKPLEVVGDLTKTSDINNLIDSTVKTFGKIDVLVNNAGLYPTTNITSPDLLSVWDQIFAVDLRAVVELIHRSVPHLEKTNGTIIDISSVLSLAPTKTMLAYSSAKAGLDMLTKILALELGPKGIRVNTINPGTIQNRDTLTPVEKLSAKYTPLGRVGQPLDIARAVAFLASTDAHFITGANVVVDGGFVYNLGVGNTL